MCDDNSCSLKRGDWDLGILMIYKSLYKKALSIKDYQELKWLAPQYLEKLKNYKNKYPDLLK
jgi:hypothetical protein